MYSYCILLHVYRRNRGPREREGGREMRRGRWTERGRGGERERGRGGDRERERERGVRDRSPQVWRHDMFEVLQREEEGEGGEGEGDGEGERWDDEDMRNGHKRR